ncbi:hypothetical protein RRX38_02880 [Pseudomonas sp. DTU_2021_1001937_2_SI_NGA_ILE_001]|uniref:carbohydrate-binding protein n=1 Tax=Pseudomonas sp. DTU_2021_1001937_2_SI_NGA_ILE_001 TaxID=3077589 RepID=UPI0028FC291A|nr:carbohydrate-binding protein [Pseudomonas sp. DTU_2021_1001937_2_SI_NGA_ILE_001]WNW10134.1 hypothetical protein RRX38_02880 [Pseudomonas sp. DTU_2021_1001937_2_SI_NGA_ILE_001]
MSQMTVVPGLEITPARLIACTLPAADYAAWSSTQAYVVGDRVTVGQINYEALVAHTNRNPTSDSVTPAAWLNLGWINRYRMFNKQIGNTWALGTFSGAANEIDLTIRPGQRVNAIGLVGVFASSVRIVMTQPGNASPIYDETFVMSAPSGSGWYQHFFSPFKTRENLAVLNLPPASNADVRVVISAPGSAARVGMLILGWSKAIGTAVYDTSLGRKSFTTVKEEFDGSVTMTKHGARRKIDYRVVMAGDEVTDALRTLDPLDATAALYVGSVELDYTIIAGTYDDLDIGLPTYNHATYTLSVRSLM